jgi:hypothetical protein
MIHRVGSALLLAGLRIGALCIATPATIAALATTATLAAQDAPRIVTDRPAGKELLRLPKEDDAFGFVVYGDRTGGPVAGIEVLAQAVRDTNLLDPDLVFTVGDLINGYNGHDEWHAQAKEYVDTMARLRMPWFPVAGNHDIYWRGAGKPAGEHERDYEAVFGPLWYAVHHKQCWFVALYSDEGNPETGEKNFNKPECQRMSEAQFAWLGETLERAKPARHVFVFLHHPRWLSRYGDDWERVHALLAGNGNVRAVFAGHIHRMRYDGKRDGIEYFTVASVGAHLEFEAPAAGFLHQFHVVTVRPEGIQVAALPVGAPFDPKEITGELSEDVDLVHEKLAPTLVDCVAAGGDGPPLRLDGSCDALLTIRCTNAGKRPLELELIPVANPDWVFGPDHQHLVIPPGRDGAVTFAVRRGADPAVPFALPQLEVRCDYLASHRRIALPRRTVPLLLPAPPELGTLPSEHEGVLVLDGKGSCLAIAHERVQLPDGPLTLELWVRGDDYAGRRALATKTETSEFGLFGSDGHAEFLVRLGDHYATAKSATPVLRAGEWHHVAGVFDGAEVRLFVDGQQVAAAPGKGTRRPNTLPLYVGADPAADGTPMSFFTGRIDDVRLSSVARYREAFTPPALVDADEHTVLLLRCDREFGPWVPDVSGRAAHAERRGAAHCTVESRPAAR